MEQKPPGNFSNIDEIKKMVMQGNINPNRLTSFKLPRDLTLGGTKTKKNFVPNLNVVRNKDKSKPLKESVKSEKLSKSHSKYNSKRPQKKTTFLQSEGLFSQGMGELKQPNYSSERRFVSKGESANSCSVLEVPTLSKTRRNISKSDEKVVLERLLANQDSDSESDSDEYSSITLPLELPSKINKSKDLKPVTSNRIKKETLNEVEQEEITNQDSGLDIKPIVKVEKSELDETPQFASCLHNSNLYDDDNPAFTFLKLPDSFPGRFYKDPDNKDPDYSLKDMCDGPIGKILVRKSGKLEFQVKNTSYVLTPGSAGNAINTTVLFPGKESIAMEPSLVTLGTVDETLTLSPNWDVLFNKAKKNPKFYY